MGTKLFTKRGTVSQFSAYVHCGQTVGWMKMPLVTEEGLGPGDIVLDGDPVPPRQKGAHTQFSAVYCGTAP